jgi:hypothetical protein
VGKPDHIDLRSYEREGWFEKEQKKIKNYKSQCKSKKATKKKPAIPAAKPECYHGPYFEAHHILPGTAIKQSGEEYSKSDAEKKRYLEEAQWVTKWNINAKPNLIGLPTFLSFEIYYRTLAGEGVPAKELVAKYKKYVALIKDRCPGFRAASRKFKKLAPGENPPEGLPIHNPTSWGHKKYDKKTKELILQQVWQPLVNKGAKHELKTGQVAQQLNDLIDHCLTNYLLRGDVKSGQSASAWKQKKGAWYKAYSMMKAVSNPL